MSDGDEELSTLVAELESTLRDLRAVVDDGTADDRRDAGDADRRASGGPRPPTFGELLRFTERYTIPTLIASLEATIEALELFRGLLRLADPESDLPERERSDSGPLPTGAGDVAAETGRRATAELTRRLRDLRSELSTEELPADDDARNLLTDARELTAELERRLDEATRPADSGARSGTDAETSAAPDEAVSIEVTGGEDAADDPAAESEDDADAAASADVDVDSELRSIQEEVDPDPFHVDEEGDADDGADSDREASGDDDARDDPADR